MKIKDHGTWQPYKPAKLPEGAPANALFVRRTGDGVDWYEYVNSGKHFAENSIKMTIIIDDVVGAATRDPTALFPSGATVLEITEVTTDDPQKTFGDKVYRDGAFHDRPPFKMPPDRIEELLRRIEALEKKET